MRRILGAACVALGIVTGAIAVVQDGWATTSPAPGHLEQERGRLRVHFDSVLAELAARDVSRLTSEQRAARAQLSTWLAEYRDAGEFPLNDLGTAAPVPIFRDSRGVLCAMAYLIDRSGRGDIVDDVAASRNTAYIGQLVDDPRLVAWLDSTGLSTDEAARIQPAYVTRKTVQEDFATTTVLYGAASAAATTLNLVKPTSGGGVVGVVVGTITVLHVASAGDDGFNRGPNYRAIKPLGAGLGIAALLTGVAAFYTSSKTSSKPSRSAAHSSVLSVSILPEMDSRPHRSGWRLSVQRAF